MKNDNPLTHRRALKYRAKQTFFRFIRPCVLAAFFLLCFSMLTQVFLSFSGGMLYYDVLDIRQFPLETGIWRATSDVMTNLLTVITGDGRQGMWGGLVFAVRDSAAGSVLVMPVAWRQLMDLVIVHAIVFLLSAPLEFGILNQFRRILEHRPQRLRHLFAWYANPRLTGKSLAVQAVLGLWRLLVSVLCMTPGLFCMLMGDTLPNNDFLLLLAPVLSLLGALLSIYLYSLLLPARYVLAQHPEYSLGQVFSSGLQLLAGRRAEYFKLNLSFLPWQLISVFLWGIPSLFVIPYVELTNYLFLDPPPQPEAPPVRL